MAAGRLNEVPKHHCILRTKATMMKFTKQRPLSQMPTLRDVPGRWSQDHEGEIHRSNDETLQNPRFMYHQQEKESMTGPSKKQNSPSSELNEKKKPNLFGPYFRGQEDGVKNSKLPRRRLLRGSSDDELAYNQSHRFVCDTCSSNRIAWVNAKCGNMFAFGLMNRPGLHHDGYVPDDIGIGEEYEYVAFEYCLDCGQIQDGVHEFPLPETYFEKHRIMAINPDYYEDDSEDTKTPK
nr:PREDICTED: uncharacterized protein LOC109029777 [Bemisia tabaci]